MALSLVDTHCHLNLDAFADDREQVMLRAREKGVRRLLVPGIDLETSQEAVRLAERYPEVYAAVGVHPHNASQVDAAVLQALESLARHPKVLAIGEIGLDFYRDRSPREAQLSALEGQLELARRLERPVVLHCREAMQALLPIVTAWSSILPARLRGRSGVLHAFEGSAQDAAQAAQAGLYLGAAGPLTYPSANGLRHTLAAIDLRHLLTETDAPYLAPQAHRGQRNEPAHVDYIATALAELTGATPEGLAQRVMANADHLFEWDHGDQRPSIN